MRRLTCALCALLFLAACLPQAAGAADGVRRTAGGYGYVVLEDGTALVTEYPVANGTVTVPGEVDGIPVSAVGQAAFADEKGKKQVRRIVIADGVRSLEADAFSGFAELASVTLPDSLDRIGDRAFLSCRKLKSVRFPEGLKTIGEEAFGACSLLSVTFPEGLETIGARAFDRNAFKQLAFPASLRSVGDEAFRTEGRPSLKQVSFLSPDTEIGERVFGYIHTEDGKTLASYTMPLPAVLKVPTLTVACLPGSTADRTFLFRVKKQYPKRDESHIRTAPAERVLEAGLYGPEDRVCEVVVPEGVEEIADGAFAGLGTLCRISLPSTLRAIGKNAFSGCFALSEISLPQDLAVLGEGCFSGCWSLKKVSIPAGVEEIPARAFADCFRLESLELPEGLKAVGEEAFAQDYGIVEFIYTAYDEDDHFSALKALALPASLEAVGRSAFAGCDALQSVAFAKGSRLAALGDRAFFGCVRLKKLVLPDGLRTLGEGVFMDDHSLAALTVPDSVTEIGESLLEGCPLTIAVTCGKGSAMDEYMKRYEEAGADYFR